jgi:flagellar M-ring protein FliF
MVGGELGRACRAQHVAAGADQRAERKTKDRSVIGSEIAAAIANQAKGEPERPVTLDMIESAPGYSARATLIRNFVRQDPARAALVVRDLIRSDLGGGSEQHG